jgi:hypothetical protein
MDHESAPPPGSETELESLAELESQQQPVMSAQKDEEPTQATQLVSKLVLHINSGNGEDALTIKVRGKTKWAKVFTSYAQAKELSTDVIRFMYDGDRIQPDNTPTVADLLSDITKEEAELGVTIDALVEQSGGTWM